MASFQLARVAWRRFLFDVQHFGNGSDYLCPVKGQSICWLIKALLVAGMGGFGCRPFILSG